jgi:hypothetical protein
MRERDRAFERRRFFGSVAVASEKVRLLRRSRLISLIYQSHKISYLGNQTALFEETIMDFEQAKKVLQLTDARKVVLSIRRRTAKFARPFLNSSRSSGW